MAENDSRETDRERVALYCYDVLSYLLIGKDIYIPNWSEIYIPPKEITRMFCAYGAKHLSMDLQYFQGIFR